MLVDDIATYLSSQVGLTPGTDLFLGTMPDSPDAVVCVYESGGLSPIKAMGNVAGAAKVERPRIQVVSRGVAFGYEDARATAHAVFLKLDGLPFRQINGITYHWGSALQSPFLMGVDEQGRPSIACNYDIVRQMSTST